MHFIDRTRQQVFADGGNAAADADVLLARGFPRLLERGANVIGYKVKRCPTVHRQGCAWLVCEHEDRRVIGRCLSPPSLPTLIGPRPANGAEHIAAQNPGADVLKAAARERIARVRCAAFLTEHLPEGSCFERPAMQRLPSNAHWMVEALVRPRAEAVDRNRETRDAQFGHRFTRARPLRSWRCRSSSS